METSDRRLNKTWSFSELRPNRGRILRWVIPILFVLGLVSAAPYLAPEHTLLVALVMTAIMGVIAARGYGRKARDLRDALEQIEAVRDSAWEAREKAESANDAKTQFLASISHEIRTPLSGIMGMTELLQETRLTPEQNTYAQAIGASGNALVCLIEDLLDMTRIEKGYIGMQFAEANPYDITASVVELLAGRAHDKGIEIALLCEPDVPQSFKSDAGRLRQILVNLLSNAIKFTNHGGVLVHLSVATWEDGTPCLKFTVEDTGRGIAENDREKLFREFERLDAEDSGLSAGLGLGLSISRHLARAMNGRLSIEDRAHGLPGAVFTLALKLESVEGSVQTREAKPAVNPRPNPVLWLGPDGFEARSLAKMARNAGVDFEIAENLSDVPDSLWQRKPVAIVDTRSDLANETTLRMLKIRGMDRSFVCLEPRQRAQLQSFGTSGFDGFLIRPIRQETFHRLLAGELMGQDFARSGSQLSMVPAAPGIATSLPDDRANNCLHVLLAEDDAINSLITKSALERQGHTVIAVEDGSLAIEALKESMRVGSAKPFDLLVTDLHMPKMGGLDIVAALREMEKTTVPHKKLPVITLSADATKDAGQWPESLGISASMVKPVKAKELQRAINRVVPAPLREAVTHA
jgi:signal transduction histidine kinase/ActR/RegA family two-component response regulator